MNLDAEDRIVAVAKLAEKDEETEIELAKVEGAPVPAELELEAMDSEEGTADDADELAFLDDGEFDAADATDGGDAAEDDEEDETVH